MANRHILHRSRLTAFLDWCAKNGHKTEDETRGYEVARVRVDGWKNPVIIYDRHEGDHLTVFGKGEHLVRTFIQDGRRAL